MKYEIKKCKEPECHKIGYKNWKRRRFLDVPPLDGVQSFPPAPVCNGLFPLFAPPTQHNANQGIPPPAACVNNDTVFKELVYG